MNVESAEVELAYTYAWWLTGEDRAARTAVLTAIDRPDVPGADADLRLEILLRRVRAAAVSSPTMCPASELAILHDAIGLGLDSAAGLVMIDAREARTELAHGRLEALGPGAKVEIVEPQRLGGLAVGNPADVAAARQNEKLGQLREMIMQGRDELVEVSRITVPSELLDAVANRTRRGPVEEVPLGDDWFHRPHADPVPADPVPATTGPDADGQAADVQVADMTDAAEVIDVDTLPADTRRPTAAAPASAGADARGGDGPDGEEIDLSGSAAHPRPAVIDRARGRWPWLALALAAIAGVAVLLILQIGPADDADVADVADDSDAAAGEVPDETTAPPTPASTAAPTDAPTLDATEQPAVPTTGPTVDDDTVESPTPEDPGADEAFSVTTAGVAVGIGGDPSPDNPIARPFEPVSISVEYDGALEGDALAVDWTVEGETFDTERAVLSPLLSTARFTKQVPEEGWPVGQHVLVLTLERTGEVVGEVAFQVAP